MIRDQIRELLRVRPFRQFQVYTPDGASIPIWHPDFAYLSPDGRTLFVYQRDYSFNMLDVMLLPRFEFGVPPPEEPQSHPLPEPFPPPPASQA